MALEALSLVWVEVIYDESGGRVAPLAGMSSVLWIALRAETRVLGLVMAAHARPPRRLDLAATQAAADEIAQAVLNHQNARRVELATEEKRAHSRLARAILCGVSTEYVSDRSPGAAREYTRAEFITWAEGLHPQAEQSSGGTIEPEPPLPEPLAPLAASLDQP